MKKLLITSCLLSIMGLLYAQDTRTNNHTITVGIPEVALLDLESSSSKNITMAFATPTEAGEPLMLPVSNSSIWLNYSSIVANAGETTRKVSAQVTSGVLPVGAVLTLFPTPAIGFGGGGTFGTPAVPPSTPLTTTALDVITGIGSAYTGNGPNKGHILLYGLEVASGGYGLLKHDASTSLTVTYTLSDI